MEKDLIIEEEGVHTVCDKSGRIISILRRDPISKKHLVYLVTEATSTDIGDIMSGSALKI